MSSGNGRTTTSYLSRATTDEDGWFASEGADRGGDLGDRRLVVIALMPGRRPFRATEPLGRSACEREFTAPERAPGHRVKLLRNGKPLALHFLKVMDHTHGGQLQHGRILTDRDGTISADWFEDGRLYGLHSDDKKRLFEGAVVWRGQSEIETTELLPNWGILKSR